MAYTSMEDEEILFDLLDLDGSNLWINPNPRVHTAHTNYTEDLTSVSPLVSDEDRSLSSNPAYSYERSESPIFSASGRRIQSALKRQGPSHPQTPRKRVSFTIPDGNSNSEEEDTNIDEYVITPLTENPTPKYVINSYRSNTQQPLLPTGLLSQKETNVVTDRLPSITRETPDEKLSAVISPPSTFKSLRTKLRGMAPVRVRKAMPASEPLKICLHCKGSLVSHSELKTIIDKAIHYFKDACVMFLQYDPLAVWSGDPAAMNRWVISLSDLDACNYLTGTGLNIHGQFYNVVSYDDVVMKEYEVYKMKQEILQESKRKAFKAA